MKVSLEADTGMAGGRVDDDGGGRDMPPVAKRRRSWARQSDSESWEVGVPV